MSCRHATMVSGCTVDPAVRKASRSARVNRRSRPEASSSARACMAAQIYQWRSGRRACPSAQRSQDRAMVYKSSSGAFKTQSPCNDGRPAIPERLRPAMTAILEDIVAEGERVLGLASEAGVPLRLLGGVAVRLRARDLPPALDRAYQDLDFAVTKKGASGA